METGLIDNIINRLLEFRGPGKGIPLLEFEIRQLCSVSSEIFLEQPTLLELKPPIKICGTFLFSSNWVTHVEVFLDCLLMMISL